MGYSAEQLRDRYAPYADRFPPRSRVLDFACGRGEFLALLRQRGVDGLGVDADASMVAEVRGQGMQAQQSDGVDFLRANRGAFDGVFAAHVIEHMTPEVLDGFAASAAAALRPGGRLIIVTPNPGNLAMQLRDFWIDLQHVRFYSPEIVRRLLHRAGLKEIEHGVNDLYRSQPAAFEQHLPSLPSERGRPRPVGREKLATPLLPPSMRGRIDDLEARVNLLTEWMLSLYPPAEYWVTGVR